LNVALVVVCSDRIAVIHADVVGVAASVAHQTAFEQEFKAICGPNPTFGPAIGGIYGNSWHQP
jgi:hypothetical protein